MVWYNILFSNLVCGLLYSIYYHHIILHAVACYVYSISGMVCVHVKDGVQYMVYVVSYGTRTCCAMWYDY